MKADHSGTEFIEHVGRLGAEWSTRRARRNRIGIDAVRRIVRRERRPPARFALGIRNGRRVAEEVDVVRMLGVRPDER